MRFVLVLLLIMGAVPAAAEPEPIVIVLSWDGMRHDYPDLGDFPGLARLEREGVRAAGLTPGWPSTTFPGHVNMATGTYADRHGIVDNRFIDRERGRYSYSADANWLQAEPLWIAAERQGVPAATYFWVGSETDWHGQRARYRIAPFDGGRLESLKVEQILAWLGLADGDRPRLIMSYWAGADDVGHDYGPASVRLPAQLKDQDFQLQRLLAGIDELKLWDRTTLMVVSDHGMTAIGAGVDLEKRLRDAGVQARVYGGAVANVYLDDPETFEAAGPIIRRVSSDACPGTRVFPGTGLPAEMRLQHPTRTGDWVVIADPPCYLEARGGLAGVVNRVLGFAGWDFGGHGYDPALPDMAGIFLAMGRGVPPGLELGTVRQVDLAATVAALLGIEPPLQSEGHPMW